MTIQNVLDRAREIWGPAPNRIKVAFDVITPMGVVFGDICRWERDGGHPSELKKELGNMILSTIRWCDELGFDAEDCIDRAIHCQELFVAGRSGVEKHSLSESTVQPLNKA